MSLQDNVRRFESWREQVVQIERAVSDDDFELDDWSVDFLESVKRRLAEMNPLTDNMDSKLNEIWDRSRQ